MLKNSILIMIMMAGIMKSMTAQSCDSSCNCSIIVSPKFRGHINVYDKPSGRLIKKVKHNFADDDYLTMCIQNENDSMFFVSIDYSIAGNITMGWVRKMSVLGVYSRAYSRSLILYFLPDEKSKPVIVIKKYDPSLMQVVSCNKNKWLQVKVLVNGKESKGWLSPNMQCNNPYTTCN